MPRELAGTVRILRNDMHQKQWHAKWTRADGTRSPWIPIPDRGHAPIALDDQAGAKAYAAALAPRIRGTAKDPKTRLRVVVKELGGIDRLLELMGETFNLVADEPEEP